MEHRKNKTIFCVSSIGNLNGSVDFEDEAPNTFDNFEDAISFAKDSTEKYGMRTYIYKCVPIIRIDRGSIRVTKLTG
jgi:hypothetical protein